ncbi:hypothetical protein Cgig2_010480 [Carnegiea gigantea]|uniref:Uncharacterized protein n=1 Tax=Carnegiea gigantea TaxID=171969 RepID=A0A9Q1KTG7_9CARY|nr:hypothetical protein Cgig2_010480 [Carnegiea gigantea]
MADRRRLHGGQGRGQLDMDDRRDVCETATESKWGLGRGETREGGQSSEWPPPTEKRLAKLGQGVAKGRAKARAMARRMERARGGAGFWSFWSGTEENSLERSPDSRMFKNQESRKKIKTEHRSTSPPGMTREEKTKDYKVRLPPGCRSPHRPGSPHHRPDAWFPHLRPPRKKDPSLWLSPTNAPPRSEGRPQSNRPLGNQGPVSVVPYGGTPCPPCGPAGGPTPQPWPPSQPPRWPRPQLSQEWPRLKKARRLTYFVGPPSLLPMSPSPASPSSELRQPFPLDGFQSADACAYRRRPGLLLKQYHPRSSVSLGALSMVWTRPRARAVHIRTRSLHVAMKKHMLCQDVGTIYTGASSNLLKISTITWWREKQYTIGASPLPKYDPSQGAGLYLHRGVGRCLTRGRSRGRLIIRGVSRCFIGRTSRGTGREGARVGTQDLSFGLGVLEAEQILPLTMPSDRSSSGVLMQRVDFILAICYTWKSFIKSAIVIAMGVKPPPQD